MDSLRNDYLNKIDKYLRPLPASERADIINEIKSQMMELEAEKRLSPDQIIQRLGFDVPWVSFQFGSWTAHPLLALPLSILFGILFMLAGKGLWKITLKYIQVVSRQKNSVIT